MEIWKLVKIYCRCDGYYNMERRREKDCKIFGLVKIFWLLNVIECEW